MTGNPYLHGFRALATDASNKRVFFSNSMEDNRFLAMLDLDTGSVVPLFIGTSAKVWFNLIHSWIYISAS